MLSDLVLAFSAGALSFFAPCVVPLLPAYVGYLGGAALPEIRRDPRAFQARMITGGLLYVAGFGLIFVSLGLLAGFLGSGLTLGSVHLPPLRTQALAFQRVGGAVVILMGLALLGLIPGHLLERSHSLMAQDGSRHRGRMAPFFLGLVFGTAWTPCVGPVLASILILAAQRSELLTGGLLLTAYTLGLGLPFIFASLLVASFPAVMRPMARFSGRLSQASGILLLGLGVLLVSGLYTQVSGYLAQPFTGHG